ncbi:MAG: hypothetical protein COA91_08620 [Robiginitomaculum sp.]|nr:MAG: hypothetical protein COA91_08620 [Robiginitomaculum sp.]
MIKILLISSTCLLFPVFSYAEAGDKTWGGEASVSGSTTSGNTSTTDIGVALRLSKKQGLWTHNFDTTYDLGKANGLDNKNRWYIGYKIDRQINERLFAYANVNYLTDNFGPFKQESFIGTGLGYQMIEPDPLKWTVEAGAGYRSQKARQSGIIPSFKQNDFALRGASKLDYKFSDAVSLYNNSEVIWSQNDTYIWNDVGITAHLAGNLAARFSFRIDHHTDVPIGVKNTDTITRGSLVYTLK